MSTVIGIDVGGSTTKIVGFRECSKRPTLIEPLFVRATDPLTSLYGAFGKFTDINDLGIESISRIMTTGVGSSYITKPIYSLPCQSVAEFECIGLGGLYLSGLERAIIVSMGTGTALVYAERGKPSEYLGGTGVGGGTLLGLSKKLIGMENISHIEELAEQGDLSRVDLRVGDITKKDMILSHELTASNFGRLSDLATKSDVALGIINMVFETVAMVAMFAARGRGIKDVVLTGNLTTLGSAKRIFAGLSEIFGINFILPERSQFSTVIGAALRGLPDYKW